MELNSLAVERILGCMRGTFSIRCIANDKQTVGGLNKNNRKNIKKTGRGQSRFLSLGGGIILIISGLSTVLLYQSSVNRMLKLIRIR